MALPEVTTQQTIIGASIAGLAVAGGVTALALSRRKKARTRRKNSSSNTRKRYTPHTAGKRKDTSRRRIRYTKKGQPYMIMASGKARFIKKSSAKRSHRQSGGRY